jgi:hypothetical protein
MARTAIVILVALSGLVGGCAAKRDSPKGREGAAARNIALPEQFAWTLEPEEMTFLRIPVSGSIHGKPFTPDQVRFHGGALRFRQGRGVPAETEVEIPLGLPHQEPVEGKRIAVGPGKEGRPPILLASGASGSGSRNWLYASEYALRLEFDRAVAGKVTGRIYLCVADEAKSYLAGDFSLDATPGAGPSRGPPGPDDAPFVRGTVRVKNQEKGTIEVGYVGQPDQGDPVADSARCPLLSGAGASSEAFAPRTTRIDVSGKDGGAWSCRRLPPGRYFLYACWNDRGAAWRWVDVRDGSQLAVDFTLDPTRTGALRVKVPRELAGETVRVVPLEGGRFPPLPFPPSLLTRGLKTEAAVRQGESRVDRLPEGSYRVLMGDARAGVEVRAAEVTLLDLSRAE